jgi:hypothetical protein
MGGVTRRFLPMSAGLEFCQKPFLYGNLRSDGDFLLMPGLSGHSDYGKGGVFRPRQDLN